VTGDIKFAVCLDCLFVCLFGTHLLRNRWTDLAEIIHRDGGLWPGHCVSHFGGDSPRGSH